MEISAQVKKQNLLREIRRSFEGSLAQCFSSFPRIRPCHSTLEGWQCHTNGLQYDDLTMTQTNKHTVHHHQYFEHTYILFTLPEPQWFPYSLPLHDNMLPKHGYMKPKRKVYGRATYLKSMIWSSSPQHAIKEEWICMSSSSSPLLWGLLREYNSKPFRSSSSWTQHHHVLFSQFTPRIKWRQNIITCAGSLPSYIIPLLIRPVHPFSVHHGLCISWILILKSRQVRTNCWLTPGAGTWNTYITLVPTTTSHHVYTPVCSFFRYRKLVCEPDSGVT